MVPIVFTKKGQVVVDPTVLRHLYGRVNSSTEVDTRLQRRETCLQRGKLVYGGGGSYTEGKTRLRRGKLVYGGERLVYGSGDLSTEGKL